VVEGLERRCTRPCANAPRRCLNARRLESYPFLARSSAISGWSHSFQLRFHGAGVAIIPP
jgi:hypothetical protein